MTATMTIIIDSLAPLHAGLTPDVERQLNTLLLMAALDGRATRLKQAVELTLKAAQKCEDGVYHTPFTPRSALLEKLRDCAIGLGHRGSTLLGRWDGLTDAEALLPPERVTELQQRLIRARHGQLLSEDERGKLDPRHVVAALETIADDCAEVGAVTFPSPFCRSGPGDHALMGVVIREMRGRYPVHLVRPEAAGISPRQASKDVELSEGELLDLRVMRRNAAAASAHPVKVRLTAHARQRSHGPSGHDRLTPAERARRQRVLEEARASAEGHA